MLPVKEECKYLHFLVTTLLNDSLLQKSPSEVCSEIYISRSVDFLVSCLGTVVPSITTVSYSGGQDVPLSSVGDQKVPEMFLSRLLRTISLYQKIIHSCISFWADFKWQFLFQSSIQPCGQQRGGYIVFFYRQHFFWAHFILRIPNTLQVMETGSLHILPSFSYLVFGLLWSAPARLSQLMAFADDRLSWHCLENFPAHNCHFC